MKIYKRIFKEVRRNPDKNPHVGAWDYIYEYMDDPDVYISFTEIDKIGINPKSGYNTPIGIYCYPIKEFYDNYLEPNLSNYIKYKPKEIYDYPVGEYAPFAGKSKYINFIRIKDKSHFVNDMYSDYGSNDYDRDIEILKDKYSGDIIISLDLIERLKQNILEFFENNSIMKLSDLANIIYLLNVKEYSTLMEIVSIVFKTQKEYRSTSKNDLIYLIQTEIRKKSFIDYIIKDGLDTAKAKNPIMSMWNITKLLAYKLSPTLKGASVKWNTILSKDLGYSGFADKSGRGYIHPSEPMQAVFLSTRAFTLLHRMENKPKKLSMDDIKVGDRFKNSVYSFDITKLYKNSFNVIAKELKGQKEREMVVSYREIQDLINEGSWIKIN